MKKKETTSVIKSIQRFLSKWFDDKFEWMLADAILDVFVSRVPEEGGRYGECSFTSDMVHAS